MLIEQYRELFEKSVDHLEKEVATLRTGRATPALLDSITVEVYGMRQPLKSLASISVQDAKTIIVEPWDKTIIQKVDNAIRTSDLGINPVSDGVIIRLPLPELTQDRRINLIKLLHKKLEECRISFRMIREDVRSEIDKAEKRKEIGEDDRYCHQEELEKLMKDYSTKIRLIGEKKEIEINTI